MRNRYDDRLFKGTEGATADLVLQQMNATTR